MSVLLGFEIRSYIFNNINYIIAVFSRYTLYQTPETIEGKIDIDGI